MGIKKYNKMELHPRTKEWEKTGVATLTSEEAKTLNDTTQSSGVKYELAKTKAKAEPQVSEPLKIK